MHGEERWVPPTYLALRQIKQLHWRFALVAGGMRVEIQSVWPLAGVGVDPRNEMRGVNRFIAEVLRSYRLWLYVMRQMRQEYR